MAFGKINRELLPQENEKRLYHTVDLNLLNGETDYFEVDVVFPRDDHFYYLTDKELAQEVLAKLESFGWVVVVDKDKPEMSTLTREEEAVLRGVFTIERITE